MTTVNVSKAEALFAGLVQTNDSKPANSEGFEKAFNQASLKGGSVDITKELNTVSKADKSADSAKDHYKMNESKADRSRVENPNAKKAAEDAAKAQQDSKVNQTDESTAVKDDMKVDDKKVDADTQKQLKAAIRDLKQAIADDTGMSMEDVEEAMEVLGLTAQDLFNPDKIPAMVMELTGETDSIVLATDEELMDMVDFLQDSVEIAVADLDEALGIEPGEINQILEQIEALKHADKTIPSDIVDGAGKSIPAEVQVSDIRTTETEGTRLDADKPFVAGEVLAQVDKSLTGESTKTTEGEIKPEETIISEKSEDVPAVSEDKSGTEKKDNGKHEANDNRFSGSNTFSQNLESKIDSILNEARFDAPASNHNVNTQDIIDQITDYMKLNIKADVTELDMQLNPESLGTLHVKVAAKEGVVTAQFTTQNEDVKAVIQSQIAELTQRLESDGVKIEAVEVTVESGAFDQNREQGNESRSEDGEPKRKPVRRLEIRPGMSLEEIAGMDEDDRLTAEMMAIEGNSVDYQA